MRAVEPLLHAWPALADASETPLRASPHGRRTPPGPEIVDGVDAPPAASQAMLFHTRDLLLCPRTQTINALRSPPVFSNTEMSLNRGRCER